MKTTEEMIAVMQAYADGKKIEFFDNQKWHLATSPVWDWNRFDYRVKEEPKFRPFKNTQECWEEMLKHSPFGWVKDIKNIKQITYIDTEIRMIFFDNEKMSLEYAFEHCDFADSTPFGIKEE